MVVKRFSGSFRTRTDILDNITPNNVVQPNVSVPAGEWKPCDWLPVAWQADASKDYFTISSGKVLSFTREGRLCPAGLKKKAAAATAATDPFVTYTQTDVDAGVRSIVTGALCTVGAVSVEAAAVGIVDRGLVMEHEVAPAATDLFGGNPTQTLADAKGVLDLFIGPAIGVAAYDVYAWAGDAPGELYDSNYQKQHLIQFFTDVQMQVPARINVTAVTIANVGGVNAYAAATLEGITFPDGNVTNGATQFVAGSFLAAQARYTGVTMTNVVGLALDSGGMQVAQHTDRTPVTSSSTALLRHRSSVELLTKAGDWTLDAEVGMLLMYEAGGNANTFGATESVSFFTYNVSAAVGDKMVFWDGECFVGDYVDYDVNSNFIRTASAPGLGRVLQKIVQPKGLLDRVRTAFSGGSFGADAQMPGTATKGFTDLITLSGQETTADTVVILNLKI